MKKILLTLLCALGLPILVGANNIRPNHAQTETTKPWTFWYWMYGEVNADAIDADLQAMKDAGIAGFYLMPIKGKSDIPKDADGKPIYKGEAEQLSPTWWKMIDRVYNQADSLGLEMGIHISDGFALAGGPWIKPEESMKRVVFSDTILPSSEIRNLETSRPRNLETLLPLPKTNAGFYRDIAVLAYPAKYYDPRTPQSSVDFPFRATEPADIIMSYKKPFTLRSLKVITGGNNIQAHRWTVFASNDGKNYTEVCKIEPARRGWQDTDAQATYSIPATKAKYFKFHWTPEGSDPGAEDIDAAKWKPSLKVANLILSSEPVIDNYEGKSGAVWRVAKEVGYNDDCAINPDEIIDLNDPKDPKDLNDLKVLNDPKDLKLLKSHKAWHIVRIGYTSTGHSNATGGGGKGLESDKFDKRVVRKQFDNWFGQIYRRGVSHTPQKAPKPLTRLHIDSWECGSQNWSENFTAEFKARRGYDLNDWLLLYAGVPVQSIEKSDKVLRDIRLTIGELVSDVFFTVAKDCAREYGVQLSTECVAPTMVSDGLLHYKHSDIPMGEFWLNSPTHDKLNDMLDAVSGAHIYGKNIIQAEGFTEVRGTWDEHPAMLKPLLDRNFCVGINSIVFHVMTHNPYLDKKPGMTLDGIGTFFQRDNTWWREMPDFCRYIENCQTLLQEGEPVVDIAVYTGDEMPRRSIIPHRLVDVLPGLFGKANVDKEHARRANEGLPMEVSPVGVNHTKNMVKADDFTNPLHGYKYDSFNHDVLSTATVVDGKIQTAYGMKYSVLVVPQARPMNPNNINTATADIARLKAAGAKIIETPWTEPTLESLGIPQDIILPEGIDYTHRSYEPNTGTTETKTGYAQADIYFLSNQTDRPVTLSFKDMKLRNARKYNVIGDPLRETLYNIADDFTIEPGGSRFILCTDNHTGADFLSTPSDDVKEIADLTNNDWTIHFETTNKTIQTNELKDWTAYDEPEIKYYSGHATYTTEINLDTQDISLPSPEVEGQGVRLSLETVNNIATVTVNGELCGTTWFPPYQVDITKALQPGTNKIEISVANTWANALLGNDLGTPPFPGIWTNGKYRRAEKTTIPAGITGRVMVVVDR